MSKTLCVSDDYIEESIKQDVMKVEVSNQSSSLSRSIIGSKQKLKVDEKAKDSMNDKVKSKTRIFDWEAYNMIEELEIKSSGGSYYDAEASRKIDD